MPVYTAASHNPLGSRKSLTSAAGKLSYFDLATLGNVSRLPFSIKILLESCLRNMDGFEVTEENVRQLLAWSPTSEAQEVPFKPARVILQDFTGVPCVVDLAAMRSAMKRAGGDPQKINPLVPVDLVIDHSVQVDEYANPLALVHNARIEMERNRERYEFLKWGQKAFRNFSVVPPATGIVHQVNLEYLASVVMTGGGVAFPDTLVGTDSHTTMINGLGVLGWGVGGIEAEAAMLGQPCYLLTPEVVGFKLTGKLREGATATDLVLTVTQMLRKHGVVGKFVEFFGPGMKSMSVADRATIGNMAPEYGATMGFFPVDEKTLEYLSLTGRDAKQIDLVERYCKTNGLWAEASAEPVFTELLQLDLGTVEPSMAGPKRPQDRVALPNVKRDFHRVLTADFGKSLDEMTPRVGRENGSAPVLSPGESRGSANRWQDDGGRTAGGTAVLANPTTGLDLQHGDIVIAAITSCTNTSNPSVMVAAGLLAKKANARGLRPPRHVKTSLAPGSRVVTDYFEKAGLQKELDALGFNTVGYGCTTCIGNSGPLPDHIAREIEENDLVAVSVLSGNRNFEGRINPHVKANYLASPPLVVAYALAGTINIDLTNEPLGEDTSGKPVYLRDLWPTQQEIHDTIAACIEPEMFKKRYAGVSSGNEEWNAIPVKGGELFDWSEESTYIQEPPFFIDHGPNPAPISSIKGARCIVLVGDSVTTDHISPAGAIKKDSPAGKYLINKGMPPPMFNSYGSRRGNDRVMTRGTFANIRLKNQLAPGTEGGWTTFFGDAAQLPADTTRPTTPATPASPTGAEQRVVSIFDAARGYGVASTSDTDVNPRPDGTPLIALCGKDYGMGSSRDWAAKGAMLLGIRAVIAESFERIHRSNLVGMGVLPLTFPEGKTAKSLCLDGTERFDIEVPQNLAPRQAIRVTAHKADGRSIGFDAFCRIDTPVEIEYYRNGGILQTVLRRLMK